MNDTMNNRGVIAESGEPTILIIDDDPNNLAMMSSFLEDRNFSILVAEDSESGLKRAHHARPDLILLDILLPQIDGYETCRRLKSMEGTKDIPVIFMTALTETEHKIKGFAAGAVDYITKPFQREEVLARVGVHLRIRELAKGLKEEKELLERRVVERTAALAQANEKLCKSEKMYRTLIETTRDLVFIVDRQGMFTYANPIFEALTGYSLSELTGRPFTDILAPGCREAAVALFKRGIKGELTLPYEVEIIDSTGTKTPVEFLTTTLLDPDGNPVGRFGVGRDITERKEAEEEHRKLENQLIQAQKMEAVGTLAGGIAHDFNNILSGIMGYSELSLKAVADRPKVYSNIAQVLKAAERARDLVRQILTFSRKTEPEKKPAALSPIVSEVVKFMRASLPTTIEIRQLSEVTSDIIMADPTQIHQVLMNLGTNAGHAMRETGGTLEIGLKETTSDQREISIRPPLRQGRYLELFVRDTGHGIAPENLARIFDPYFTTKAKGEGTGLGLAVVHGIVKEHGGEIRVYSEVGKGTIFRVYLPLMEREADSGKEREDLLLHGKGELILFIDDEKMVVDMSRELLEELGYRVVTETDPVQGIETFKKDSNAFDLVITDKTMPHLTGFEVAEKIRGIRGNIPIFISSGLQEKDDLERIAVLGVNRLIMKPIRITALANAIREVLENKQKEQLSP